MPNEPGKYEFRYLLNDSYTVAVRSSAVQVTAASGSGRTTNRAPSLTRILVTREALSNGRVDTVRPISDANPLGLRAVAGFGNPDTGIPGLFTTIATQPNPRMISLDLNQDGRVDESENPLNQIVVDAAKLPTCFTLVVAEGLSDPDGDPVGTRWEYIGTRFGSGNLYATVNIPSANIFAGMELSTYEQLSAYTANSIIYEAPDYGLSLGSVIYTKNSSTVRAAAFDAPPAPLESRQSESVTSPVIDYANSVKVEIAIASMCQQRDGSFKLELQANLFGFDPLGFTWFRWALDGNGLDIVKDVPASNLVTFHLPANMKGQSVNIYVAASSKGPSSANPNPFVQQPPEQFVSGEIFKTVGSAVAAMTTLTISDQGGCREICGDGLDNDGDKQVDEDCNFKLFVHDNKCEDDTIGVSVDGRDLGMTPTGKGRFFDISQLEAGEHTLVITAVASGGQPFGCSSDPIVTYGLEVPGGARIIQKNGTAVNLTRDSGDAQVGTRVIYRIVIP